MRKPALKDFLQQSVDYDRVPLVREIFFDTGTPISVASAFVDSEYFILLESVEGGEKWARYSYIAVNPSEIIQIKDNGITIKTPSEQHVYTSDDPIGFLKAHIAETRYPSDTSIPGFCTGFAGYFSYDSVRYNERVPDKNPDILDLPDIMLLRFDEVYVFDHLRHTLTFIVNADARASDKEQEYRRAAARIDEMETVAGASLRMSNISSIKAALAVENEISRDRFLSMVERAREYIHEGDIFQVVLSQRIRAGINTDPFNIYRMLRTINPSPYMFHMKLGNFCMLGASPEMLMKVSGGIVETCPIAGTRKRGSTEEEDAKREAELLSDPKEIAEHMMLVDLGRNDIGKISQTGSVEVENLMHIERFSHVMHMVTNVKGRLKTDLTPIDALMSVLPAGTLSGAPKIRAMEIIDELEPSKRGPYGGAAGFFSFNGNSDFCITIRTLIIKDGYAYIQAGAGIVADSDPEREYEETLAKAEAMLRALEKAGE